MNTLLSAALELRKQCEKLDFSTWANYTYHPLNYAWDSYKMYVEHWGGGKKKVLFLGMNPGPWGMAQTGIPFGEVEKVRHFLRVETTVNTPGLMCPQRPVEGFACARSEVSGKRLWGLFQARFKSPQAFFENHFVLNFCPLLFLKTEGKRCVNLTPDKMPQALWKSLQEVCQQHLKKVVEHLQITYLVGVGAFATKMAKAVPDPPRIVRLLHPSPASPAANKDWAGQATKTLEEAGVWK